MHATTHAAINAPSHATLAQSLLPKSASLSLHSILLVVGGSLALAASAKVQIPFHPVPVTMQTFVLLTLAMAYGWRLACATVALYLLQGAIGLPVFAGTPEKGIGIAYMLGGTGGYLLGFLLAAALCGWLAQRGWDRNILTTALAMLLGNAAIYVPGLLWLGILFGWDKPILEWGLFPFLYGDGLKLLLAALLLPATWHFMRRRAGKAE